MTGNHSPLVRPVAAFIPIVAGIVALLAMSPLHAQLPSGPACVPGGNRPPVAEADSATTYHPAPVTINVLANDTDPDGNPLTITLITQPSRGTAVINAGQTITFTPPAGFTGAVQFSYVVKDGVGGMAAGTVDVNVKALVLALGFDEGVGTTVADASGFGNNGAVSGASWSAEGKYGGALTFDGVNDLVTVADARSLDVNHLTITAWVKPSALGNWRSVILKQRPTTGLAYALYADTGVSTGRSTTTAGGPGMFIRSGGYNHAAVTQTDLTLDVWTHLAATYDGLRMRLYVDAAEVASFAVTSVIGDSAQPLFIGGNAIWGEFFKGTIDDVRVYTLALAPQQIQVVMAGLNP